MSCSIYYKWKTSTSAAAPYSPLTFSGSSAKLLSIVRAIISHRKISLSGRAFTLLLTDGETGERIGADGDFNIMIGGGTKLIVSRRPCEKGCGLLGMLARAEAGMRGGFRPGANGANGGGTSGGGGSVVVSGGGVREVFRDESDEEDEEVLEGDRDEVSLREDCGIFVNILLHARAVSISNI